MKPALIIVDVQNDFCEGGSLAVSRGAAVAGQITEYLNKHYEDYAFVAATQDYHVDPGDHFSDHPDYKDTWPPHCVAGTEGANLHPNLDITHIHDFFLKGEHEAAYSGTEGKNFSGQSLVQVLESLADDINDIHVVGIATDYCVKATAIQLSDYFPHTDVRVLLPLTAAVSEETAFAAIEEMDQAGVWFGSA